MKVNYNDYDILVERGDSISGEMHVFYSVVRKSDGYECMSGFESPTEKINRVVKNLKEAIDNEILQENPWGPWEE